MSQKAKKPVFRVLVEGGRHDEFSSAAKARKVAEKFRAEGWNVQIIKVFETIVGEMAVRHE